MWWTHKRRNRRSGRETQIMLYSKEHLSIVEREYLKK